ncbi:hypothetical protein [Aphanothece sacrum]|uniref:Uncharacterized protein n=1 Tax=Aphanothece sacrum FPU1 TaxID=1920663 RepID=A0A401ICM7_APHSA|nr:hypothetical protein [Aphanothece sacrum]GBF79037.1 hypothetical protein AsFPU1_0429 [Aphanothece sacrum FPU1]GBF86084.1 hypothetical protein AsFPU3_3154 [Aphanothece sacrum FPU3]
MIRERLVQEYLEIINRYYPKVGDLLKDCHVTLCQVSLRKSRENHYYYLAIYYSSPRSKTVVSYQNELKEVAENLGLVDVTFLNAKTLIRDPLSQLKQQNPRLWLELYWLVNLNSEPLR